MINFISSTLNGFSASSFDQAKYASFMICYRKNFYSVFVEMGYGGSSANFMSKVDGLKLCRSLRFIMSLNWVLQSFSSFIRFM